MENNSIKANQQFLLQLNFATTPFLINNYQLDLHQQIRYLGFKVT